MQILKNPITYKILIDILFLILLVAIVFIASETLLPGIISAYISPLTLFGMIFIIIFILHSAAHIQDTYTYITKSNKYLTVLSAIIFTVLVAISNINYGYVFDSIIVIFSFAIFLLLNKLLQDLLHNP